MGRCDQLRVSRCKLYSRDLPELMLYAWFLLFTVIITYIFSSAEMNLFRNGEDHGSIVIGATAEIIAIFPWDISKESWHKSKVQQIFVTLDHKTTQ